MMKKEKEENKQLKIIDKITDKALKRVELERNNKSRNYIVEWLGFRTDHGRPHRYPNHPTKESLFKVIDRHVQRAMGYQGDDAK